MRETHGSAELHRTAARHQAASSHSHQPSASQSHAQPFSILSYNVCGLNNHVRHTELCMFLAHSTPSVMVIQEPKVDHLNGRTAPSFPRYHTLYFQHPTKPTGIVMYIHDTCTFKQLIHIPHCSPFRPRETTTTAAWVWVSSASLPHPVVIGGVYLSHSSNEDDIAALADCARQAAQPLSPADPCTLPVFLVGDFNARHVDWEGQEEHVARHGAGGRGNWLCTHLLASSCAGAAPLFTLLNTRFRNTNRVPTHTSTTPHRSGDSVLDLAMASPAYVHMVSRMDILADEYIRSDHMPILLTFRHPTDSVITSTSHTRWRIRDANWPLFAAYLTETLPLWTAAHDGYNTATASRMTQRDIDRCWSQLHNIINIAADRCIGTCVVTSQSQHWWSRDPAIPSLHAAYRTATDHYRRLRHRRAGSVSDTVIATARANSQHAKRAFQQAATAARRAASDDMVAELDDASQGRRPKLVWSQLARIRRHKRTPLPSFPDSAGSPPRTPIQALNNMARHLQSVSSLSGHTPSPAASQQHDTVRNYMRTLVQHPVPVHATVPFTRDDVVHACSSFRLNTALGSDRVSPYFLKYGGAALHSALFLLFSIVRHGLMPLFWKHGLVVALYKEDGDVNDPNNYRPLCMTSVVARILRTSTCAGAVCLHVSGRHSDHIAVRLHASAQHP